MDMWKENVRAERTASAKARRQACTRKSEAAQERLGADQVGLCGPRPFRGTWELRRALEQGEGCDLTGLNGFLVAAVVCWAGAQGVWWTLDCGCVLRGELMGYAGELGVIVKTEARTTSRSGTAGSWGGRTASRGTGGTGFRGKIRAWILSK